MTAPNGSNATKRSQRKALESSMDRLRRFAVCLSTAGVRVELARTLMKETTNQPAHTLPEALFWVETLVCGLFGIDRGQLHGHTPKLTVEMVASDASAFKQLVAMAWKTTESSGDRVLSGAEIPRTEDVEAAVQLFRTHVAEMAAATARG